MTGFGKAIFENEKRRIIVEIKSVNSKSLDLQIKLPQFLKEKEIELRQLISTKLFRGKIDAVIEFEDKELPVKSVLNSVVINEYFRQFKNISSNLNYDILNTDVFQAIMRLPDVMKTADKQIDEQEWLDIIDTFNIAILEIEKFRIQEGNALEDEFQKRINIIEVKLLQVPRYEADRILLIRNRIKAAIDELKDIEVDKNRFEQELIYYLEKLDITEEKVRLLNHCRYFKETINKESEAGKKLVFISQEIGREINTLGSKANNYELQKLVVEMKDELEKIKEQLLNIL